MTSPPSMTSSLELFDKKAAENASSWIDLVNACDLRESLLQIASPSLSQCVTLIHMRKSTVDSVMCTLKPLLNILEFSILNLALQHHVDLKCNEFREQEAQEAAALRAVALHDALSVVDPINECELAEFTELVGQLIQVDNLLHPQKRG